MTTTTIKTGKGFGAAQVRAESLNKADRTVEIIWAAGAAVPRYSYDEGRYIETLSMDPAHIRLDRFAAGMSLLDSHDSTSMDSRLGSVVPGSVRIDGGKAYATVKLSRKQRAEELFQDLQDGHSFPVSVGYRTYAYEKREGGADSLPILNAVDWEPLELSAVPIPADGGAHSRSEPGEAFDCEVRMVAAGPASDAADTAVRAERDRNSTITELAANAHFEALGAEHVRKGTSVESFRTILIEAMIAREESTPTDGVVRAVVGTEHVQKRAAVIEAVLFHRTSPDSPLPAGASEFRGMTLVELAREALAASGVNTRGMSQDEIAGRALAQRGGGLHGTSDFSVILGNTIRRTLRAGYDALPQTFRPFTTVTTVPDYKVVSRVQIGEAPRLEKVNEAGEFKRGTIGEGSESYKIATYGKIFAITRRALVNDDLDAFKLAKAFGQSASQLESDLVWAEILSNPTMGDAVALFHATHNNLGTPGTALSSTSAAAAITAARVAMVKQRGIDGQTTLNVRPAFLITGQDNQDAAERVLHAKFSPATTADAIPKWMREMECVAEPRLDNGLVHPVTGATIAGAPAAWYLAAAAGGVTAVELAYLEGATSYTLETRMGFNVDAFEIKCRLDAGAKVIDWRAWQKNVGA